MTEISKDCTLTSEGDLVNLSNSYSELKYFVFDKSLHLQQKKKNLIEGISQNEKNCILFFVLEDNSRTIYNISYDSEDEIPQYLKNKIVGKCRRNEVRSRIKQGGPIY